MADIAGAPRAPPGSGRFRTVAGRAATAVRRRRDEPAGDRSADADNRRYPAGAGVPTHPQPGGAGSTAGLVSAPAWPQQGGPAPQQGGPAPQQPGPPVPRRRRSSRPPCRRVPGAGLDAAAGGAARPPRTSPGGVRPGRSTRWPPWASARWSTGSALVRLSPGRHEQEMKRDIEMVRRNFGGLRQVTVVNPKGGAGKTVAILLLAMTFGQKRGGYVLAWDNNETQGTLGMRAAAGLPRPHGAGHAARPGAVPGCRTAGSATCRSTSARRARGCSTCSPRTSRRPVARCSPPPRSRRSARWSAASTS